MKQKFILVAIFVLGIYSCSEKSENNNKENDTVIYEQVQVGEEKKSIEDQQSIALDKAKKMIDSMEKINDLHEKNIKNSKLNKE